jgi:hypothetical protein
LAGIRDERIVPPVRASLLLLLPVVLFAVGCGGAVCEKPSGHYRVVIAERSGDCRMGDSEFILDTKSPPKTAGCTNETKQSADGCRVTLEGTCAGTSTLGPSVTRGVVDWARDGSSGSGIMDMTYSSPNACHSTYDISYERI